MLLKLHSNRWDLFSSWRRVMCKLWKKRRLNRLYMSSMLPAIRWVYCKRSVDRKLMWMSLRSFLIRRKMLYFMWAVSILWLKLQLYLLIKFLVWKLELNWRVVCLQYRIFSSRWNLQVIRSLFFLGLNRRQF